MAMHPFHLIGIYIGGRYFYTGGQVNDGLSLWCGLPYGQHCVANISGKGQFGGGKHLGGVLKSPGCVGLLLGELVNQSGGGYCELNGLGLTVVKHHSSKDWSGGVIDMDNGLLYSL